jgi:hypothetical protein
MLMSKKRQASAPESSSTDQVSSSRDRGGSGNAHMQERLGLQGPAEADGVATEKPKNAKVILSARKGGSPFSSEFWTNLNVGHCWVDVVTPEGRKDSWGFTANSVRDFPRYQPWKSVAGRVLHPDGSRGATGTLSRDIDEDQLKQGEDFGKSAGSSYNLFGFDGGHSCATFAKGFFEASTGESAPSSMFGALIASPNDLSAAMNEQVEEERQRDAEDPGRTDQQTTD